MALKHKLSATQYEALNDALKGEYTLVGDEYVLDVEGLPSGPTQADLDALAQAKAHEKAARQAAEKALKELKAAGEGNGAEAETLRGEITALTERLNSRDSSLKKSALEAAAGKVTSASKFPKVLAPHVMGRLQADIDESGNAVVTILDASGKPSKMTFDELTAEFKKDKEFEGLMLGSQASGSGTTGQPTDALSGDGKKLKDMSEAERVAMAQTDPDGFKALVKANVPTPA